MRKLSLDVLLIVVFLLSASLLLVSCGSSGTTSAATVPDTTPTAAPAPATVTVTADDYNNSSINLKTGDTLVVELKGNPSTGYQWQQIAPDTTILRQLGEPAFTPDSSAPGAPGKVEMRFEAVGEGYMLLQLVYQRPFEPQSPPAQSFQLNVTVAASASSPPTNPSTNGGSSTGPSASGIPADPPAIKGTITSVNGDSVLVEENPGAQPAPTRSC